MTIKFAQPKAWDAVVLILLAGARWLVPILLLVFVVLKLAAVGDVAGWSWWWVLSPLWVGIMIHHRGVAECAGVVRSPRLRREDL